MLGSRFDAIRKPLRIKNFRLYVIGNLASNIATWLQKMAVGWLTWELTESAAWLGVIALAEALPTLAFSMFAGTVIDRVNFFRLLKIAQGVILVYALLLLLLTATDIMTIWFLLALTILRGLAGAFYRPARMTLVYGIVGRDLLPAALGINATIFNGSRFIGPAIGSVIIVFFGVGWAFAVIAMLYVTYTVVLQMIDVDGKPISRHREGVLQETIDGFRYIVQHVGIRGQMIILVGVGLLAKPVTELFPGFAGAVYDQGAAGLGWLLSAHGLGAMFGALYISARGKGLAGMTQLSLVSLALMAVALVLFAATPLLWLGCIFAALMGFAFIVYNIANQTLIQSAIDPSLRGRVLGTYGMIQQGAPALGALVMGATAQLVGMQLPVAIGAVLCLVLWAWAWPKRGESAMKLETTPEPTIGKAES